MNKGTRKEDKHPFGRHVNKKACNKKKYSKTSFDVKKKTTLAETDLGPCLKLVSAIFYQIFIFRQMIALQKV